MTHETIEDQAPTMSRRQNGLATLPNDAGDGGTSVPADSDAAATSPPSFTSPQQFYRELTSREDIKRILTSLAQGGWGRHDV